MVRSVLVHPELWAQKGKLFEATLVGIFKQGEWSKCREGRFRCVMRYTG